MLNPQAIFKHLDHRVGPAVCRGLSRPQRRVHPETPADVAGRLLVIRPGGIGDLLLLLPALEALQRAYPNRPLDLLCERRNAAVASLSGLRFDTVMCYDSQPLTTLRRLRRGGYAAVIDTEQFHHFSAVLGALSGAPIRIGFHVNPRRNGLYTHLAPYDLNGRENRQFESLVRIAGGAGDVRPFAGFLRDRIPAAGAAAPAGSLPAPLLVLHAGAGHHARRWPVDYWVRLCREAVESWGMSICLVGTRSEAALAGQIRQAVGDRADNACGRLTLVQTATVCRDAAVFVGADSGISHLAVALGVPSVTLFGPSDPRKWSTDAPNQCVIRHPQPCSPCALFGYLKPCACVTCMQAIPVEEVLRAIRTIMTGR